MCNREGACCASGTAAASRYEWWCRIAGVAIAVVALAGAATAASAVCASTCVSAPWHPVPLRRFPWPPPLSEKC